MATTTETVQTKKKPGKSMTRKIKEDESRADSETMTISDGLTVPIDGWASDHNEAKEKITRNRPHRERAWFARITDTKNGTTFMHPFKKKTDMAKFFTANPEMTLADEFVIWGWAQQVQRVQTVRF